MQLREVIADLTDDGAGGCVTEPPADWRQGRTLYGGLTAALCTAAGRRAAGAAVPLRSVQIAFIAPAAGRLRVTPTLLRRGRSAAFVGVEASAEDVTCARATLVYGVARASESAHDHAPAPQVPGPAQCAPLPMGPDAPPFMGHFEVRHAGGGIPFSGSHPEFIMWARHRDNPGVDPTIALVAVADVLPPAAAVASPAPRPVSSVTWSLNLVQPTPPTEWYLLRSASEYSADGYSLQTMGCWDESGRCLALGAQVVAVF
jgi:acyl-CoA thioesterase